MPTTTYLILFSANLVFIATHVYGWLLKWFYRPKAYREQFHELFPAQRSVGVIYLLQLFELPYLLQIGDADALLYVNAFAVMCFSFQMLVMCEGYFFPKEHHRRKDFFGLVIPAAIVVVPLLVQAVFHFPVESVFGGRFLTIVFVAVSLVLAHYLWLNVSMALKIGRAIRDVNEATYADSDDFPLRFAQFIQWVPTMVLVLLVINFYANDPWVKFVRDVLFIAANVTFCIFTLNPWRKGSQNLDEEEEAEIVNDTRYDDLARRLEQLLTEEQIYTTQHLDSSILLQRLGTNTAYLTEAIHRCGYQSFYDMINQHRVRHAISLIHQRPDLRLQDIAEQCGFSSPSNMTKVFSAQGKQAPSSFRERKQKP